MDGLVRTHTQKQTNTHFKSLHQAHEEPDGVTYLPLHGTWENNLLIYLISLVWRGAACVCVFLMCLQTLCLFFQTDRYLKRLSGCFNVTNGPKTTQDL